MKKQFGRMLALALAVVMAAGLLPAAAWAEEPVQDAAAEGDGPAPAAVESGTCGDNLTWTLDDNGTLTISGPGAMADYYYGNMPPWYGSRNSIISVDIQSGVTAIGDFAFIGCRALTRACLKKERDCIKSTK